MRLSPLTWALYLAFVVQFALNVAIILLSPTSTVTVLHDTAYHFARFEQFPDSWNVMMSAINQHHDDPGAPLYRRLFFEEGRKFQYPPTSLLALSATAAAAGVGPPLVWQGRLRVALSLLSWMFTLVTIGATMLLFERSLRHDPRLAPASPLDTALRFALVFGLGITFYPVMKAFSLGQIQAWINAFAALALFFWMDRKPARAGILFALASLLKPQYALVLVWGVVRRERSFVIGFLAVALAGLAISIATFGLRSHLEYLDVLAYISRHGESYYPNQSVNGILHRLLGNGPNLEWTANSYPPWHPVVAVGTALTSFLLLAWAIFGPTAPGQRGSVVDLGLVLVASAMASPVAWEHHYGILLPVYAILVPQVLRQPVLGRATIPVLVASYFLTANFFEFTARFAAVPALTLFQSYLFAGALLVLILLGRLRLEPAPTAQNLDIGMNQA